MKQYLKISVVIFAIFTFFITANTFAMSNKLKSLDVNNINLNSIEDSKKDEVKNLIKNININSLNSLSARSKYN